MTGFGALRPATDRAGPGRIDTHQHIIPPGSIPQGAIPQGMPMPPAVEYVPGK